MIIRAYHETYGLNTVITNCSNNYGPKQHDEKFIPTIIRNALKGNPITIYGDGKLPRGPVASLTLNIINNLNEEDADDLKSYTDEFLNILELKLQVDEGQKITKFIPKTTFNQELFSKSELKIIEDISKKYKNHTKDEISQESHLLKEYINTQMNSIIELSDMVEDEESKNYITFWQNEHKQFNKMLQA